MPLSVAVIGASTDRTKFGNRAVRAYRQQGYVVYPVHPTASEIEGVPAYASFRAIPADHVDRVTIYLPASVALPILDDVATKSVSEVFFNPGADDAAVLERARALGLPVVVGCSLLALGLSPHEMD